MAPSTIIAVPGEYDPIRQPTLEEQRLFNQLVADWTSREVGMKQGLGIHRWIDDISGRESLARYLFDATLTVDGVWSGYTGRVSKTILP